MGSRSASSLVIHSVSVVTCGAGNMGMVIDVVNSHFPGFMVNDPAMPAVGMRISRQAVIICFFMVNLFERGMALLSGSVS